MASTRLEINFNRLLNRCEAVASDKSLKDWRLEKYIGALQNQLSELKKAQSKPCDEILSGYTKKVELLKGLIEAEKMPTASEKAHATDLLSVPRTTSSTSGKQLHMQAKVMYQQEMRDELLGSGHTDDEDVGLRQRQKTKDQDIDTVLQHHHQIQEKLAEEMLVIAQGLKHNVTVSGKIVQDDIKKVTDSTRLAETNLGKLKTESERLQAHTKACSWWIWVMLVVVIITFCWMVLLMRLFPKKS
ncbi:vesicle transport protein USE1-like [Haliotis asinina]|uniref:vesicle transport protein USE1-like n=1 Tax=Haliotis asinina TaxID=109174 RepID=UPI0035318BA9